MKRYQPIHEKNHLLPNQQLSFHETHIFTGGVDAAWVRHYGSGLVPGGHYVKAITIDSSGNVYITGRSINGRFSCDYLTVKYDVSGIEIWTARYNGPDNSYDVASGIIIDHSGNVIVTGTSDGCDTGDDYLTIKYSPSGEELWTARYNGPGNSFDRTTALAVDDSNNVIITGYSYDSDTNSDYLTVKYSPTGEELWTARYNGPGNSSDGATTLALDDSNNVIVTGYSKGFNTKNDYATIKYSPSGEALWTVRYNGPGNSSDWATALVVDDSGNVIVTGYSNGSGTYDDYLTIKYSPSGEVLWTARYNGPENDYDTVTDIAIDDSGNIFVTGSSYGSSTGSDYLTIKYSTMGDELWTARYSSSGSYSYDQVNALVVDHSGNVIVTGRNYSSDTSSDYLTIKYNQSGEELWTAYYDSQGSWGDEAIGIAVDHSDNVIVAGSSYGSNICSVLIPGNYLTIKYNLSGEELWTVLYSGPSNSIDDVQAAAVDGSGNIFMTGSSCSPDTYRDYLTIKYSPLGEVLWTARYNSLGNSSDEATALTIDHSGNVVVTGISRGFDTHDDFLTIKYSATGDVLWTARYNGPGNSNDKVIDIVVDHSCNVIVTGNRYSTESYHDKGHVTIKYRPAGEVLWTARYDSTGDSYDIVTALAVDHSGNVIVTGYRDGSDTDSDYFTIKYSATGEKLWTARYNGMGINRLVNCSDVANGIAVDDSGNIYITGYSSNIYSNCLTIKYNAYGDELWVRRYNGSTNSSNWATDIAVDHSGNVIVTGNCFSTDTDRDYLTIKYSESGEELWTAQYNGTGNYYDVVTGFSVDDSGNVIITGLSRSSDWKSSFATIQYSPSGEVLWTAQYAGPGYVHTEPTAVAVDKAGNVIVAGTSHIENWEGDWSWSVYTIIKYIQTPTSVKVLELDPPECSQLLNNYPNPFNSATVIGYQLSVQSHVKLTITDLMGRTIFSLVDEIKDPGNHTVSWDGTNDNGKQMPSGIYLYQLKTDHNHIFTGKMILVK